MLEKEETLLNFQARQDPAGAKPLAHTYGMRSGSFGTWAEVVMASTSLTTASMKPGTPLKTRPGASLLTRQKPRSKVERSGRGEPRSSVAFTRPYAAGSTMIKK